MKIIQCLSHFLPERQAGTEVYAWALSRELKKAGHEVLILIPRFGEKEGHQYEYDGLSVWQYPEPSGTDRSILNGRRAPEGLKAFLSLVQELHPDLVHFHEYSPGNGITVRHIEVVRSAGIPTVMTMHLSAYSCRTGRLMYRDRELCDGIIRPLRCAHCSLEDTMHDKSKASLVYAASVPFYKTGINTNQWNNRIGTALGFPFFIEELQKGLGRAAASLDRIIVLTQWYRHILERNGVAIQKLNFIPQGLPYQEGPVARKEWRNALGTSNPGRPIRIIFIGRIDPFKGLHLLLKAFATLDPKEMELDIYGQVVDEPYYHKWRSFSENLTQVSWKGVVSQRELIPMLSTYDALCLPSTFSEMSPLVIQEAFAAGIPVIGSDVYGIAEQVKDGINGLLFPFNNAGALKERLQKLSSTPGLLETLTRNTRRPPSFAEVARETEKVYISLTGKVRL